MGTVVTGAMVGMMVPFETGWAQGWAETVCTGVMTLCWYACGGYGAEVTS